MAMDGIGTIGEAKSSEQGVSSSGGFSASEKGVLCSLGDGMAVATMATPLKRG